jgi:hypothetical protein
MTLSPSFSKNLSIIMLLILLVSIAILYKTEHDGLIIIIEGYSSLIFIPICLPVLMSLHSVSNKKDYESPNKAILWTVIILTLCFSFRFALGVFTMSYYLPIIENQNTLIVKSINIKNSILKTVYRLETEKGVLLMNKDLFKVNDKLILSYNSSHDGKVKKLYACTKNNICTRTEKTIWDNENKK